MSSFWDEFTGGFQSTVTEAMDNLLGEKKLGSATQVRELTDKGRLDFALPIPAKAGTRVSFNANLGAVLTYKNPPEHGSIGTVIVANTGAGQATHLGDMVFVQWDGGEAQMIDHRHLRAEQLRVASLGDLTEYFDKTAKDNELVHKATNDFWSLSQDGEEWVIERLADDSSGPIGESK